MSDKFLTPEEEHILDKNLKYLDKMVEDLFKGGLPPDGRDRRIAKEILAESSAAVLKRAEIRQKQQADDEIARSNQLGAAILAKAIESKKNKRARIVGQKRYNEIDDSFVPETVPGELDKTPHPLNVDDFVEGDQ